MRSESTCLDSSRFDAHRGSALAQRQHLLLMCLKRFTKTETMTDHANRLCRAQSSVTVSILL